MSVSLPRPFFALSLPGYTYPGVRDDQIFDRVVEIARAAEEAGFAALFAPDHLQRPPIAGSRTDPQLESYLLLAGIAARTTRLRLGVLVSAVLFRNPALLAKMATTLDVMSAGRAILGLGAGWYDEEHRAYGYAFPPIAERMDRLEEALRICRALFAAASPTVTGRYYRVDGALNEPRPIQPGGPPILVGGSGERRTLRLVASYADIANVHGDPETVRRKLAVLDEHCAAVGRDPAAILRTWQGGVMIARSHAALDARLEGLRRAMAKGRPSLAPHTMPTGLIAGDPDEVAAQIRAYLDAGLDGMTINIPDVHELEPIALLGETLAARFGGAMPATGREPSAGAATASQAGAT